MAEPVNDVEVGVVRQLPTLDRYLPVWILLAMAIGLLAGRMFGGLNDTLDTITIDTVSLPIAIGLFAMMYPVLAKVKYSRVGEVTADRKLMGTSLVLNWVVGPAVMFALAWIMLPDLPAYRTGLIIVGLARCIAMVLIWNDLACGSGEAAAVLVALNSVFQVVAYAILGWFYLEALPQWLGLADGTTLDISVWSIAKTVLIFLGLPLLAGYLTRLWGERVKGVDWYENVFLPRIGPVALWGLLYTVVIMFALQGETITSKPFDVVRIALPLLAYFAIMWFGSFFTGYRMRFTYEKNTSMAFTAAGNNFELAIAVAIGVFGIASGEALATVVGPLIEVPALIALVYAALWARRRFYNTSGQPRTAVDSPSHSG
jgi:ACR3 family arsenite transporter